MKKQFSKPRFSVSGLNTQLFTIYENYEDYVQDTVSMLKVVRADDMLDAQCDVIALNQPAEYVQKSKKPYGVILIHGLYDSCAVMQSLFNSFSQQEIPVKNLLLPGHGSKPGDLLYVNATDWIRRTTFAISCMRKEVNKVIIVGLSTGATLGLYCLQQRIKIDKLILIAPALSLKNRLSCLIPCMHRLSKTFSSLQWVAKFNDDDLGKYQSMTTNSVYQLQTLMNRINSTPNNISIPIYIILSDDDETIRNDKAIAFFNHQSNPLSRLLIYTTSPQIHSDKRIIQRNASYPQLKIINFSHACMTVSPSHPYYGQHGLFADDNHYHHMGTDILHRYESNEIYYGAVSIRNLKQYHLHRLRYNPDYDYLFTSMIDFITQDG